MSSEEIQHLVIESFSLIFWKAEKQHGMYINLFLLKKYIFWKIERLYLEHGNYYTRDETFQVSKISCDHCPRDPGRRV